MQGQPGVVTRCLPLLVDTSWDSEDAADRGAVGLTIRPEALMELWATPLAG